MENNENLYQAALSKKEYEELCHVQDQLDNKRKAGSFDAEMVELNSRMAYFDKKVVAYKGNRHLDKIKKIAEDIKKVMEKDISVEDIFSRIFAHIEADEAAIKKALGHAKKANVQEVVVARFPDIQVHDAAGNTVPFEYAAYKRYGGRGENAEAFAAMKSKGLDNFKKHLTSEGRTWLEEEVVLKRGNRTKKENLIYIEKLFSSK